MKRKGTVLKLYVILSFGILFCIMTAMILSSEQGNLETFYDMGEVADVSSAELLKPNDKWVYDSEQEAFVISGNKAIKTFRISAEEKNWGWMYLTIEHMSVPWVDAKLVYYNEKGERRYIEDITLQEGENILDLEENCPCTRIGLSLQNADGQTLLITRMQVRELMSLKGGTESILKIFVYSFGIYAVICALVFLIISIAARKRKHSLSWFKAEEGIHCISRGLSFYRKKKRAGSCGMYVLLQRTALSVLFLFLFWKSIFLQEEINGRFLMDMLIVTGLVIFFGFFQSEIPVSGKHKADAVRLAWSWFVFAVLISDLMVGKEYGHMGVLFFIPLVLVARRYRTKQRYSNLCRLTAGSLELVFVISVVFAFVYFIVTKENLQNLPPVFNETIAMTVPLVFFAFLTDLLYAFRFRYLLGALLTLAVCALCVPAPLWIGIYLVMLLFAVMWFAACLKKGTRPAVKGILGGAALLSLFLAIIIFLGRFPEYQIDSDKLTVWKNYSWRLNLFGNPESALEIFAVRMEPYNAYLAIAFRYGIFVLIPYILMQILLLKRGFAACLKNIKIRFMGGSCRFGWDSGFFSLSIVIAYISFCFTGNIEKPFGTPLWMCYYLIAALSMENTGVLELEAVNKKK